jgi:hypothetical protein
VKPLLSGLTRTLLAHNSPTQVLYGSVVGAVTDPSGSTIPAAAVRGCQVQGAVAETVRGNR